MKKNIIVVLILMLLLTGCGNNESEKKFLLNDGVNVIEKKLSNMEELQDTTLTDAYNMDLDLFEEHVFKQNSDGDFYAIIKPVDKGKVKSNMGEFFERVREFNSSYSPERLQLLENRVEKELDGYLIYIIANDSDSIYDSILDSLN